MTALTPSGEPRIIGPGFNRKVYALASLVPPGRVSTYGDIATALGSVRVARQVGYALAALDDASVPWHRIINREGRISGRGDTLRAETQEAMLRSEGVIFDEKGRCDLKALRWVFAEAAVSAALEAIRAEGASEGDAPEA